MSHTKNGVEYTAQVKDVANKYGYTDAHVRELARNRAIPSIKVGRRYWFNLDKVESVLVYDNTTSDEVSNNSEPDQASEAYSESNQEYEDLIAGL